MYSILHNNYTFISTVEMDRERKELGWDLNNNFLYELNALEGIEEYENALTLAKDSDVMIIGSAPEFYVKERMQSNVDKITLRYSERIYKRGRWRAFSPRGVKNRIDSYFKYYNRKLFMLCASAYTSADLSLQGSYLGKCYKWGYFPETIYYNPEELLAKKRNDTTVILWVGRLIELKHPEVAITMAHMLKLEGIVFHMNIIGTGILENSLRTMILDFKLEDCVTLLGSLPPKEVRRRMEESNIFLATSNFQEGWGAVVNEAMNSGCAIIASHATGCVPYLIKDGVNGLVYQNGNIKSLSQKLKHLIHNKKYCLSLGKNAYETIISEWNAKEAVRRLLLLIDDLNNKGTSNRFESGPCSKAELIRNNWYRDDSLHLL